MRRSDREITDTESMIKIMEKCDVCRLAFHNGEYPYILPLNFGMQVKEGTVTLYFHGATEGTKYELIAQNPKVSFEMDCSHRLVLDKEKGSCTMEYESVIGNGLMEIIPNEEKLEALHILMRHYRKEDFPFNQNIMPQTTVFKLVVKHMTGKARMVKR